MSASERSPPRDAPSIEVVDQEMATVLAAKSGAERLLIASGMFRSARRMLESHLRASYPDWSDGEIATEICRRFGTPAPPRALAHEPAD